MNDKIRKFNKSKLEDLSFLEQLLISTPPRIGASANALVYENDMKLNLAKSFIYYYRLLELSFVNLKKYKDDKETIENTKETINDYYKQYSEILEQIKNRDYEVE